MKMTEAMTQIRLMVRPDYMHLECSLSVVGRSMTVPELCQYRCYLNRDEDHAGRSFESSDLDDLVRKVSAHYLRADYIAPVDAATADLTGTEPPAGIDLSAPPPADAP